MTNQKLVPYVHADGTVWDHYFVDSRTGIIYFERRMGGKKHKFSTREKYPNGIKAKRFANAELEKRLGKRKINVRTLIGEELDQFLKIKEGENLKYDTMNNVRRAVSDIRLFWGDKLPNEINADNIAEWFIWWASNKKDLQMENVIKYMRNFCQYLARKTHNGFPILPAIPKITDPNRQKIRASRKKKKENIFSQEEFRSIYKAASSLEERIIALMMYTMATRVTETLEMSFGEEINLDQEVPTYRWRVNQNKAGLEGFHALHPSLIEPLKELRETRSKEGTDRLFPQKWNINAPIKSQQVDWKAWEKRAGIGWHWTPHTFRHTCLSNLFNDPNSPQLLICKLYRISYKEAEETYVKPTREGIERMRTVLKVSL